MDCYGVVILTYYLLAAGLLVRIGIVLLQEIFPIWR